MTNLGYKKPLGTFSMLANELMVHIAKNSSKEKGESAYTVLNEWMAKRNGSLPHEHIADCLAMTEHLLSLSGEELRELIDIEKKYGGIAADVAVAL
jgi:hypothetical protein